MAESRIEDILTATINGEEYTKVPLSRIEILLIRLNELILEGGGGSGGGITFRIVSELPVSDISTSVIYFLRNSELSENKFTEYVYIDNSWEILGNRPFGDVTNEVIDEMFSNIPDGIDITIERTIVEELPEDNIKENVMYLLRNDDPEADNAYTEYMYINGEWEIIGNKSTGDISTDYIHNLFNS